MASLRASSTNGGPASGGRRIALLSVVVPIFNEGANIDSFFTRVVAVLDGTGLPWEIVCINDGSRDNSLERLIVARAQHSSVRIIDFSRNFGKEPALSAGLARARGDIVIPIDADLQHPPELIPDMIEKWRQGFDVVYALRANRAYQSGPARFFAHAFYWIFDRLSDVPLPAGAGDFRLLDRRVVDVINGMPERTRFMKGIFAWVGFRQTGVTFNPVEREKGNTKWGFFKLLRFAFDGLTAFSNFPLKVWGLIGAAISLLAFVYIVIRLLRTAIYGIDVPGYESIIVTILFLGGMQLLTLGIIGDYIGRVFNEVKGRPLYIVRAAYGFERDEAAKMPAGEVPEPERIEAPH
ncbi:MAG TPA: glycosyltransferase family 2 protein [Alphaproteobacteria bacterium]|nr:glycosyltransferase family 2 protein [Alphaproteobacteria bacterium]